MRLKTVLLAASAALALGCFSVPASAAPDLGSRIVAAPGHMVVGCIGGAFQKFTWNPFEDAVDLVHGGICAAREPVHMISGNYSADPAHATNLNDSGKETTNVFAEQGPLAVVDYPLANAEAVTH